MANGGVNTETKDLPSMQQTLKANPGTVQQAAGTPVTGCHSWIHLVINYRRLWIQGGLVWGPVPQLQQVALTVELGLPERDPSMQASPYKCLKTKEFLAHPKLSDSLHYLHWYWRLMWRHLSALADLNMEAGQLVSLGWQGNKKEINQTHGFAQNQAG